MLQKVWQALLWSIKNPTEVAADFQLEWPHIDCSVMREVTYTRSTHSRKRPFNLIRWCQQENNICKSLAVFILSLNLLLCSIG